jgi:hypothetical protein
MQVQVNPENFERAESDRYFSATVGKGGFGTFVHDRELVPLDFKGHVPGSLHPDIVGVFGRTATESPGSRRHPASRISSRYA